MKTQLIKKDIFSDLERLGRIITYALIFFYLSQLIWPYIELPHTNPFDSHGQLAQIEFNPSNNSLRLAITLAMTILGPTLISLLSRKYRKIIMRFIFVTLLGASYFLLALVPKAGSPNIDILHDGIKLGNAALFLGGRRLFSELLFLHGAFLDSIMGVISFFLLGRSVGSYFLFTGFLLLMSLLLFFTFLALVIRSELVFYLSSLWFFNLLSGSNNLAPVNFSISHIRDIIVWIVLILLWLLVSQGLRSKKLLFIIGFLSGWQYFVSADRGYFLTLFTLFLFAIFTLFSTSMAKNKNKLEYIFVLSQEHFKKNIKKGRLIVLGLVVGLFTQLPLIGFESFKEFLIITFWRYPRMIGNFSEQEFKLISQHSTFADGLVFWLPIFLIIFNGIFLFDQVALPFISKIADKKRRIPVDFKSFFALVIFAVSVIFFRSALVRTGVYHLNYASTITFFLTFFILDRFFFKSKILLGKSDYYRGIKYMAGFVFMFWALFNYSLPLNYQMKEEIHKYSRCDFKPKKEEFTPLTAYFGELFFCPPTILRKTSGIFYICPKNQTCFGLTSRQLRRLIS